MEYKFNGYHISKECIDTANELFEAINNGHRSLAVSAPCQSGKTGIMIHLAMKINQLADSKSLYYLCGDHRNDLHEQTKSRLAGLDITIFRRSELMKKNAGQKDPEETMDNSLIFHDESHYATQVEQHIHQFYIKHAQIDMAKPENDWINRNIIIVGLSATSFTEQYINESKSLGRYMTNFIPSTDYRGIRELMEAGKIFQSKKLKIGQYKPIMEVINKHKMKKKYMIMRANSMKYFDAFSQHFKTNDIQIPLINNHYHSEEKTNINEILVNPPDQFTIIMVYQSLSQGDTIIKDHVCALYESPPTTIEATLQQFLGRACGFGNYELPEVYTDLKTAKEYLAHCEDPKKNPLTKLKYISGGSTNQYIYLNPMIPQYFKIKQKIIGTLNKSNILPFLKKEQNHPIDQIIDIRVLLGTSSTGYFEGGKFHEYKTSSTGWDFLKDKSDLKVPFYNSSFGSFIMRHTNPNAKTCTILINPIDQSILIIGCDGWKKKVSNITISDKTMYNYKPALIVPQTIQNNYINNGNGQQIIHTPSTESKKIPIRYKNIPIVIEKEIEKKVEKTDLKTFVQKYQLEHLHQQLMGEEITPSDLPSLTLEQLVTLAHFKTGQAIQLIKCAKLEFS